MSRTGRKGPTWTVGDLLARLEVEGVYEFIKVARWRETRCEQLIMSSFGRNKEFFKRPALDACADAKTTFFIVANILL